MAWTAGDCGMATGLTADALAEHIYSNASHVTVSSNRLQFPTDTNNKTCMSRMENSTAIYGAGKIGVFGAHLSVSGSPTAEIGLLGYDNSTTGATKHSLRIGTDRTIKLYNTATNTLLASSTTAISTTAASPTEVVAFYDALTLNPTVFVSVFIDGVEEIAINTGLATASIVMGNLFGMVTPAGSNCGASMQAQYIYGRYTTSLADAPYAAQYPRLLAKGGVNLPATSEGTYAAWANGTTASPNTYQDIDETTGNDGDTSKIIDTQTVDPKTRHKHTFHYSAANPFSTETIDWVQLKCTGKLNATGKNFADFYMVLAGSELAKTCAGNTFSTAYLGYVAVYPQTPAAGTWAVTDFDLTGGVSKIEFGGYSIVQSGTDTSVLWTLVPGPEGIYHTASLPLSTNPISARGMPVFMGLGVGIV